MEQASDPDLLAVVLERATHQRFASYLSQSLWRRIGAADAWLWLDHPGGAAHAECCMMARQGDWIRIAELLLRDGNYQGAEVVRPGWVALLRAPLKVAPVFGSYVRLAPQSGHEEPYAAAGPLCGRWRGGNRLWLIPSLQLAILATGPRAGRDAQWDDSRIPNLIIRAARDFVPAGAPCGDSPPWSRRTSRRRSPSTLRRQLAALFLFCVIDTLGFGILIPLVPYMANRFGAPPRVHHPDSRQSTRCASCSRPRSGDA